MRFADSNLFLYAFLRPRREPPSDIQRMKERAAAIVRQIEQGEEEVATSIIHLSETANIVEAASDAQTAARLLQSLLGNRHIEVLDVNRRTYELAVPQALELGISPNDALAFLLMSAHGLVEIYSFDKHFDRIPQIRRVT